MNELFGQSKIPTYSEHDIRQALEYNNMKFVQVTTSGGCSVAGGSMKGQGIETKGQARLQGDRHALCQATSHRRWGIRQVNTCKTQGTLSNQQGR